MARKSVETFSQNNENKTGGAKKSMKKQVKKHAKKSMKKRKLGKKSRVQSRKSKGKKMSKKLKGGGFKFPWTRSNNLPNSNNPGLPMPKVIFFDVDGTLADKGRCGLSEIHDSDTDLKERFIKSLKYFEKNNVSLYVLTRCELERNIENNDAYYNDIKPFFNKLIGAKELNIATNPNPDISGLDDGGTVWAYVKSYVMEKIAEKLGIDHKDIYLIDDDRLNAKVASSKYGFNVITTYSEEPKDMKIKPGGLTMTDNGLRKILFDNTQEIYDSDLKELMEYPIEPKTFTYVSPTDYDDKLDFQIQEYQLPDVLNNLIINYVRDNVDNNVDDNFGYQSIYLEGDNPQEIYSDPYLGDEPGAGGVPGVGVPGEVSV